MSADIVPLESRRRDPYYSTRPVWDRDGWILPFPVTWLDKLYREWDKTVPPFMLPYGPDEAA